MPGVALLLLGSSPLTSEDDETASSELSETIPLHLLSSFLLSSQHLPGLLDLVWKKLHLCLGQAEEALENIC